MILFFPQWQGAGQGKRIDQGAHRLIDFLRAEMTGSAPLEIALDPAEVLTKEAGIWGRAAILRQLNAARNALMQQQPERLFTIGGDCGIEVIPVGYLNARYANFALVWLDGHADLNTPESSPSGTFHGMPLRVLMGEGDAAFTAAAGSALQPQQVVMAGVRDLDPAERDYMHQQQILNLPVDTPAIAARLVAELTRRGVRHIYIHFDLDVLDPHAFPYMHYPAADGFSVATAAEMVEALADSFEVVGMSLTEYDSSDGKGLDLIAPLLKMFTRLATRG